MHYSVVSESIVVCSIMKPVGNTSLVNVNLNDFRTFDRSIYIDLKFGVEDRAGGLGVFSGNVPGNSLGVVGDPGT